MSRSLEERIQHLEDLEAIRHLKHYYYCQCIDRSIAGDKAAIEETISRFSDDIVADFTGMPLVQGMDEVTWFFRDALPMVIRWSQHRVMNEVINIDGDTASAIWYVDCPTDSIEVPDNPLGFENNGFISGRYQEEYVRENDVWKWKRIVALLDVQKDFPNNWVGAQQIQTNR